MKLLIEARQNKRHSIFLLPFIESIKENRVNVEVSCIIDEELRSLFEAYPLIDRVFTLKKEDKIENCFALVNEHRYDILVSLSGDKKLARFAEQKGIRIRVGFTKNKAESKAFTDALSINQGYHIKALLTYCREHILDVSASKSNNLSIESDDEYALNFIKKQCHPSKKNLLILIDKKSTNTKINYYLRESIAKWKKSKTYNLILVNYSQDDGLKEIRLKEGQHIKRRLNALQLYSLLKYSDYYVGGVHYLSSLADICNKEMLTYVVNKDFKFSFEGALSDYHDYVDCRTLYERGAAQPNFIEQFNALLYKSSLKLKSSSTDLRYRYFKLDFPVLQIKTQRWSFLTLYRLFRKIFKEQFYFVQGNVPSWVQATYSFFSSLCIKGRWPKVIWIKTNSQHVLNAKQRVSLYMNKMKRA